MTAAAIATTATVEAATTNTAILASLFRVETAADYGEGLTTSSFLATMAAQDFLLFALRHVEVVQRAGDLHADLVELFGRDVQLLVGRRPAPCRCIERVRQPLGRARVSA